MRCYVCGVLVSDTDLVMPICDVCGKKANVPPPRPAPPVAPPPVPQRPPVSTRLHIPGREPRPMQLRTSCHPNGNFTVTRVGDRVFVRCAVPGCKDEGIHFDIAGENDAEELKRLKKENEQLKKVADCAELNWHRYDGARYELERCFVYLTGIATGDFKNWFWIRPKDAPPVTADYVAEHAIRHISKEAKIVAEIFRGLQELWDAPHQEHFAARFNSEENKAWEKIVLGFAKLADAQAGKLEG